MIIILELPFNFLTMNAKTVFMPIRVQRNDKNVLADFHREKSIYYEYKALQ